MPEGEAKAALSEDHEAMLTDDVMIGEALTFGVLMDARAELEEQVNRLGNQDTV